MSFDAGAITGSVGLDLSDMAHGILQAQSLSQVFPQIVTEFLESPLLAVIEIAKEAGDALKEMLFGVSESQHAVAQTAEALGVSVEFLDGWRKSAERMGVQADEVNQAITFMSRSVAAAAKDAADPAAQAYAKLGISVTDAAGRIKPVEQLARETADALSHMQGGAERTGIAMELFGRGGAAAISFFAQGSAKIDAYTEQLRAMGDLTNEEQAKSAEAFNELLADVGHAWDGIKATLAEPLKEELTPILKDLMAWIQTHSEEIKQLVHQVAQDIVAAVHVVGEVAEFLIGHFDGVISVLTVGLGVAATVAVKSLLSIIPGFKSVEKAALSAAAQLAEFGLAKKALAGAAIGATIGDSVFGGTGGTVGGGVGGLAGGIIGQALIPVPGVGFVIGTVLGSLLGGSIGHEFDSPSSNGQSFMDRHASHAIPVDEQGNVIPKDQLSKYQAVNVNANVTINQNGFDRSKIGEEAGKKIQAEIDRLTANRDAEQNTLRQARGRAD